MPGRGPRDTFITVYGRRPVLEVLEDPALEVDKIVLASNAGDRSAQAILDAAAARGVRVLREPPESSVRHGLLGKVADPLAAALTGQT